MLQSCPCCPWHVGMSPACLNPPIYMYLLYIYIYIYIYTCIRTLCLSTFLDVPVTHHTSKCMLFILVPSLNINQHIRNILVPSTQITWCVSQAGPGFMTDISNQLDQIGLVAWVPAPTQLTIGAPPCSFTVILIIFPLYPISYCPIIPLFLFVAYSFDREVHSALRSYHI